MRFKIDSNYIFAAIGAAGAGAPVVWPDQKWIGTLLIVAAAVVFVLGVQIDGFSIRVGRPHLGRLRLNIYVATMMASALVFGGTAVAYFVDRARGPIIWSWGPNSPIAMSMSSGGPLWIDGFQIAGENRWDELVVPVRAFIRSDFNGQIVQLAFAGDNGPVKIEQAAIPGHRKFFLVATLPSRDERHSSGIVAEAFRADFPKFTLVVELESVRPYIVSFSEADVDALLAQGERANRDALKRAAESMPNNGVIPRRSVSQPAPVAAPTPAVSEEEAKRTYTERLPRELMALYEGRTPFQAEKLLAPYKGQWIVAEGKVLNLLPDGQSGHSIAVLRDGSVTIECRLDSRWGERVTKFDKGDTMKVRGEISANQNGSQLYLLKCEIL
jgi:hypothetical protein